MPSATAEPRREVLVHKGKARLVWLAQHPSLAILAITIFSFLFLVQGALRRWPLPSNMDEFSVLLGADTFAHLRVTNATPPLWQHFETLHVIFTSTYASKYPPAPAIVLALARRVFGNPIWALWLSTALACGAITWMLMAWLPARWAVLGGFFAALHPLIVSWGRFYLCCNLGVLGAALLLGSAKRLTRRCTYIHGLTLGVAIALVLNVRPYEGAVLTASVAGWLLIAFVRNEPRSLHILSRSVVPIMLITVAGMSYYNWRVTGSPMKMPYAVHAEQYDSAPPFWFQKAHPKWDYRHANLLEFHVWEMNTYLDLQDISFRVKALAQRLKVILFWFFDISMIALLWFVPLFRRQSLRPVLVLAGIMLAAFLLTTWLNSNYVSVVVPLYFLILTECLRRVSRFRVPGTGLLIGPLLVFAFAIGTLAWALQDLQPFDLNDSKYGYAREKMIQDLLATGDRHLIFVRYSAQHPRAEEWIYNDADIPNAQVIWAHDMGPEANEALIRQYSGRKLWELEADVVPQKLIPLSQQALATR